MQFPQLCKIYTFIYFYSQTKYTHFYLFQKFNHFENLLNFKQFSKLDRIYTALTRSFKLFFKYFRFDQSFKRIKFKIMAISFEQNVAFLLAKLKKKKKNKYM